MVLLLLTRFLLLFFIVTPIVGVCNCSLFCCSLLYVHSCLAIILTGKRELVPLLSLSSWCFVIVVWLFLVVLLVCLQFVIVVFPDHTHYFGHCLFCIAGHRIKYQFMRFSYLSNMRNHINIHEQLASGVIT